MKEQNIYVPDVAKALAQVLDENAKLLRENGFSSDAEKIQNSFNATALRANCDAFFEHLDAEKRKISGFFDTAKTFLRFSACSEVVGEIKTILAKHDVDLEYFKTKVMNNLVHVEEVKWMIQRDAHLLLGEYVPQDEFINLVLGIINKTSGDIQNLLNQAVLALIDERSKANLLVEETPVQKEDGPVVKELSLIERLMEEIGKKQLTEEERRAQEEEKIARELKRLEAVVKTGGENEISWDTANGAVLPKKQRKVTTIITIPEEVEEVISVEQKTPTVQQKVIAFPPAEIEQTVPSVPDQANPPTEAEKQELQIGVPVKMDVEEISTQREFPVTTQSPVVLSSPIEQTVPSVSVGQKVSEKFSGVVSYFREKVSVADKKENQEEDKKAVDKKGDHTSIELGKVHVAPESVVAISLSQPTLVVEDSSNNKSILDWRPSWWKKEGDQAVDVPPASVPPKVDQDKNNGGPSALRRLLTWPVAKAPVAESLTSAEFSEEDVHRKKQKRMERLNDEIGQGNEFLVGVINEHFKEISRRVELKLDILSGDLFAREDRRIKAEIKIQEQAYINARGNNEQVIAARRNAAVERAVATRWWTSGPLGFLKYIWPVTIAYRDLERDTRDYLATAYFKEHFKRNLDLALVDASNSQKYKSDFSSNINNYNKYFGNYLTEAVIKDLNDRFFDRLPQLNALNAEMANLEPAEEVATGRRVEYPKPPQQTTKPLSPQEVAALHCESLLEDFELKPSGAPRPPK